MRLTSDFVVSALVRRVHAEGAFATVAHRGDPTAGAIFILVDGLNGEVELYGPAPPMTDETVHPVDAALTGNRIFAKVDLKDASQTEGIDRSIAERYLERQLSFDPDLWVVDIEDRDRRSFVPLAGG